MPGGFTSPSILFLNTWDAPERSYCRQIFAALPGRGYTRYVEPCAGAFAMPMVAAAAGWKPGTMESSDCSLFTAVVGTMLDRSKSFEELQVAVDGELVPVEGKTRVEQAAHLLYVQLLTRMEVRPAEVVYWQNLVHDLHMRKAAHVAQIAPKLQAMDDRLGGLRHESLDMFAHMERVLDDPHTVVSLNAPTYTAGFERFFDTKGRLTWAEPEYEVFDPDTGNDRIMAMFLDRPALLVQQQQRPPGEASHPRPVFARHLSAGQYVYLNSNRPDEVFSITGGPKVATRNVPSLEPLDLPPMPLDHELTPASSVRLLPVASNVADWYRGHWMHRLNAEPGPMNVLLVVDGYAAGVIGYNAASMTFAYADKWSRHIILRFAFGAPHDSYRLTRLATMVALQRSSVELWRTPLNAMALASSEGLVTVEYTRHPESKGLRGLMKIASRDKHPDGYKLVYGADWRDQSLTGVLAEFLTKETQWRKSSTKAA
jgi:hypothetical protein